MYLVSVTWMDGYADTYDTPKGWEVQDGVLHISYELESYAVPLVNVRVWKAEKQ